MGQADFFGLSSQPLAYRSRYSIAIVSRRLFNMGGENTVNYKVPTIIRCFELEAKPGIKDHI